MAQITKTVNKTTVIGDEVFIYTINAAYSGLTKKTQEGKIVDFFPYKIKYILPPIGGQIKSITQNNVEGGTLVTFNLGSVNSGTSLSFTIACCFDNIRTNNDSYTNNVKLLADDEIVDETTAQTVNLKLKEDFILSKFAKPSNIVNAGDEITFVLSLYNNGDVGATISNVIVTDELPKNLIPITDFTPIGKDNSFCVDSTVDGLTGSFEGNVLTFKLPKYSGSRYDITFKAKVSNSVIEGQTFLNTGKWSVNGEKRNDAPLTLLVFDPNAAGFELIKYGTRTTLVDAPINYKIKNRNVGNVTLSNYELEDIIPSQIDITSFSLEASLGLSNYSIFIALESNKNKYIPIVVDKLNGPYPHTLLNEFIPINDRIAKIKLTAQNLLTKNSEHRLLIYGTTNSSAQIGSNFTNEAIAKSGDITQKAYWQTVTDGASDLTVQKKISPIQDAYYPLEEFDVSLIGGTINTICIDPILIDLMPKGLRYVLDSEYFLYYEKSTGITYDSRESGFPVPLPTREIIENFSDSSSTLIRWKFSKFILPTSCNIQIIFKVFVEINAPSTFLNKGYMGVSGDNIFWVYDEVIDELDVDGDGLTNDRISCKEVGGVILTTSEFSLKKFVKGEKDLDFSSNGISIEGGDVNFRLQITNNQQMDLKNIEIVDILPFVGDKGVILTDKDRNSEFNVYASSIGNAKIVNIIGDDVEENPNIVIEYSTSNDPKRFDELGNLIGNGDWSVSPPIDITTIRSIKITTGDEVILRPYDRLIIDFVGKVPVGTPFGKIAYNSYAVRANKIIDGEIIPLLPTEPNKVSVTTFENNSGCIGSFVWLDENKNGIFDEGEKGVNGVKIELYDENDNLLKTTFTTNNDNGEAGYYLFTNLLDGIYKVKFIAPKDYSLTIQNSSKKNGSKANELTGVTDFITMSNAQQILDINEGVVQNTKQNNQAIIDVIESVALEQTALSHILNAEGEKIQKAIELGADENKILEINKSVESMVNVITELEIILKEKLELFENYKDNL